MITRLGEFKRRLAFCDEVRREHRIGIYPRPADIKFHPYRIGECVTEPEARAVAELLHRIRNAKGESK